MQIKGTPKVKKVQASKMPKSGFRVPKVKK